MIDAITSAIVKPRSALEKFAWVIVGVAVAILSRLAIDAGGAGIPFATIWPVLLLAAIFLGWRYALLAAGLCVVLVICLFMPPGWLKLDGSRAIFLLLYLVSVSLVSLMGDILYRVVLENRRRAEQSRAFNEELQHRTKNSLQIMRSLISRAARADDPAAYCGQLSGRLEAMIAANELLGYGVLPDCNLRKLIESAIAPFDARRFDLSGCSQTRVTRQAATPLVMALHELGTNATKYGALSDDRGQVAIHWLVDEAKGVLEITWEEIGGPDVLPPARSGLGSRILQPNGGLEAV